LLNRRTTGFPLSARKRRPRLPPVDRTHDIVDMIELIQFPWSPFCIVQRRILEFSGVRFKITNLPPQDRSRVWELTRKRYYGVPIIRDGKSVVFEVGEDSQVIAKYLDSKLQLGLFPRELEGVQSILWRFIENEVEGATFRLNDIYYAETVPPAHQLAYLRFKERKFGRGCIDQWRAQRGDWLKRLEQNLVPFEEMLMYQPFLLGAQPRFVDFDLHGMLGNFLYTGHYRLPAAHTQIKKWHRRMGSIQHQEL
jgi:glutathione S-transferase